jgi:hypothetical protein
MATKGGQAMEPSTITVIVSALAAAATKAAEGVAGQASQDAYNGLKSLGCLEDAGACCSARKAPQRVIMANTGRGNWDVGLDVSIRRRATQAPDGVMRQLPDRRSVAACRAPAYAGSNPLARQRGPQESAEDVMMLHSGRHSRRAVLSLAASVAALGLVRVSRAQTIDGACALGFVNGLLQFERDCPLLDPPGTVIGDLDYAVAPPHHLVALVAATEGVTETGTESTRIPQSGSRRKRQRDRLRKREKARRQKRQKGKNGGGKNNTPTTPTPTP